MKTGRFDRNFTKAAQVPVRLGKLGGRRRHSSSSVHRQDRGRTTVVNVRGYGRLGLLAIGWSVGAALASSPGMASADSSTDWLASIDSLLGGGALPALSSGSNLAISYDGVSLLQEGNATAITNAGQYGLAIANGDGAYAYAGGGLGDVAQAQGTNAFALAGGLTGTGANYDTAIDMGNNSIGHGSDGAFAGNGDLAGGSGTGSYDTAIDIGNNTAGSNNGAVAGAGALGGDTGDGNNDFAIDIGNNSGGGDGADAVAGDGNYASEIGNITGYSAGAYAYLGNNNTAIADSNYSEVYGGAYAAIGNNDTAIVYGPLNADAAAQSGHNDTSLVFDPFSATHGVAETGYGFSNDLAVTWGVDGTSQAVTADGLYDILTTLGHQLGSLL
jgi:hypothetical protein